MHLMDFFFFFFLAVIHAGFKLNAKCSRVQNIQHRLFHLGFCYWCGYYSGVIVPVISNRPRTCAWPV